MPQPAPHKLTLGRFYDRPFLAEAWGYRSFHAISRGVFTPRDTNLIILFVTEEKQEALTQYKDKIVSGILFWEGEQGHGSDRRIIEAEERGDEIHLFHRFRHHSPFAYLGRIYLTAYQLHTNKPSEFQFRIPYLMSDAEESVLTDVWTADVIEEYAERTTERQSRVTQRVGQAQFRRKVLDYWGGCAVTGVRDERLVLASHIKPWRCAAPSERLSVHNGLALTPALDLLFDRGLATFDTEGALHLAEDVQGIGLDRLGVEPGMTLRRKPSTATVQFLEFHRRYVYRKHLQAA